MRSPEPRRSLRTPESSLDFRLGFARIDAITCRRPFNSVMPALIIDLSLSTNQLMAYYRGQARAIRARATTGQMVQFPASALQKYILEDGVRGRFRIEFDDNHKFIGLEPIATSDG